MARDCSSVIQIDRHRYTKSVECLSCRTDLPDGHGLIRLTMMSLFQIFQQFREWKKKFWSCCPSVDGIILLHENTRINAGLQDIAICDRFASVRIRTAPCQLCRLTMRGCIWGNAICPIRAYRLPCLQFLLFTRYLRKRFSGCLDVRQLSLNLPSLHHRIYIQWGIAIAEIIWNHRNDRHHLFVSDEIAIGAINYFLALNSGPDDFLSSVLMISRFKLCSTASSDNPPAGSEIGQKATEMSSPWFEENLYSKTAVLLPTRVVGLLQQSRNWSVCLLQGVIIKKYQEDFMLKSKKELVSLWYLFVTAALITGCGGTTDESLQKKKPRWIVVSEALPTESVDENPQLWLKRRAAVRRCRFHFCCGWSSENLSSKNCESIHEVNRDIEVELHWPVESILDQMDQQPGQTCPDVFWIIFMRSIRCRCVERSTAHRKGRQW